MHPNDFYVQQRIDAFWEEAAKQRLVRPPAKPGAGRHRGRVGERRAAGVRRPIRAAGMALGLVLVRIGVALGAPPLDNV